MSCALAVIMVWGVAARWILASASGTGRDALVERSKRTGRNVTTTDTLYGVSAV